MTTHVTYKPHYCDRRYGEYVSDRVYHMRLFGIPRSISVVSNLLIGRLNSMTLPDDDTYLCNGAFELYPAYYKKPDSVIVTMMKELTFWKFDSMPDYKKRFLKKLFSANKGIITDTRAMKSLIERHVHTQIEIVNPFCAQPFLENKPKLNSKNLIFVGSFESPNKGYTELLRAFELLRKRDPEWSLYMVGKRGTDYVGESAKGVNVTNFVPSLKPYLSKCSILVHPAHFEPFGINVLEAMSAGVIPIVTKQTGVSEVLEDNGLKKLIVPNNKPETIKEKILHVYNLSAAKKLSTSRKCRKIVSKNYLEGRGLKSFKKKFNSIVG